ncbi:heterokaryon incompatibility protein-domain-containing protein [Hypoxylon rubiginosum]|uniref:Heterokaryon incompatibility protein-domain-containing protein n=1 Tax=Hypoxylon rubiginosum TaxID=110542 RepID=A0ACC0D9B2_9PEZI|nr:heterokaryon incompatibility protein-domain-containing protein [Hypoxylon rubiginosum]
MAMNGTDPNKISNQEIELEALSHDPLLPRNQDSKQAITVEGLDSFHVYAATRLWNGGNAEHRIRLLHLDPPASEGRVLRGTLKITSLNPNLDWQSTPVFAAVSYVWGTDSKEPHFIACRSVCDTAETETQIPISANCYRMIKSLQPKCGLLPVWIDAICINQNDDEEKARQLPLMGQIYSLATTVVIWLGNGDLASDAAMACFESRTKWLLRAPDSLDDKSFLRRNADKWMRHHVLSLIYDKKWAFPGQGYLLRPILTRLFLDTSRLDRSYYADYLENILQRDWRMRAWTFQEIILARNPMLLCGDQILDWPSFIILLSCIQKRASKHPGDTRPPPSLAAWRSLIGLWAIVDWYNRRYGPEKEIAIWDSVTFNQKLSLMSKSTTGYFRQRSFKGLVDVLRFVLKLVITVLRVILIVVLVVGVALSPLGIAAALFYCANLSSVPKGGQAALVIVGILFVCAWIGMVKTSFWGMFGFPTFGLDTVTGAIGEGIEDVAKGMQLDIGEVMLADAGPPPNAFKQGIAHSLRERQATNPRDKAYALYGILQRAGAKLTAVDYGKPPSEVYRSFFTDLISWDPAMVCLILDAGLCSGADPHASWVPNWANDGWRTWLDPAYVYFQVEHSADGSGEIKVNPERGTLDLNGHWLDDSKPESADFQSNLFLWTQSASTSWSRLRFTGRHCWLLDTSDLTLRGFLEWLLLVELSLLFRGTDVNQQVSLILQALEGSPPHEEKRQIPEGLERCVAHVRTFISGEKEDLDAEKLVEVVCSDMVSTDFALRILESILRKRLRPCITSEGYFGLAPWEMNSEDRIALAARVPVPLVLRRISQGADLETYNLVGPMHLCGAMPVQLWVRDLRSSETISIA